jgi:hypothetical protein
MDTRSALTTPMRDAARSVRQLWDDVIELSEQLRGDDWLRPTPDRDLDVCALVVHLAGATPTTSTAVLLEQLRAARDAQAVRLAGLSVAADEAWRAGVETTRDQRLLRASCLDMFVHAHDLATALGHEPGLDNTPAAIEACRYLMPLVEHLLTTRVTGTMDGPADAAAGRSVRLEVPGVGRAPTGSPGADVVATTPAALVLLLSGRADPDEWRRRGAVTWSGPMGEAFVRRARLFS